MYDSYVVTTWDNSPGIDMNAFIRFAASNGGYVYKKHLLTTEDGNNFTVTHESIKILEGVSFGDAMKYIDLTG